MAPELLPDHGNEDGRDALAEAEGDGSLHRNCRCSKGLHTQLGLGSKWNTRKSWDDGREPYAHDCGYGCVQVEEGEPCEDGGYVGYCERNLRMGRRLLLLDAGGTHPRRDLIHHRMGHRKHDAARQGEDE